MIKPSNNSKHRGVNVNTLIDTLCFIFRLMGISLKASYAKRAAFYIEILFMILNNAIYFSIWWFFFREIGSINGWNISDLSLLFAHLTASVGLALGCGGGIQHLADRIHRAGLDPILTQPKPALVQLLASQSRPSGWGDLCCAMLFFAFAIESITATKVIMFIINALTGATILLACGLILSSLAFWLKHTHRFIRQVFEFIITLAGYPPQIFVGWVKFILFSIVPAGFISFLPTSMVQQERWDLCLTQVLACIAYSSFAIWLFHRGLRQYESGNAISTSFY